MSAVGRITAITLTVAAALTLSACGGDSDSEDKAGGQGESAGADPGTEASKAPGASASPAGDRPTVELPSDIVDEYEDWKTGDDVKDAVLTDTAGRIDATNDAIVRGDASAPGLPFYYRGKALTGAVEWVQEYQDANLSFTGTTRYFDPKVTLRGSASAAVVYCADESKGFNKNRKTGKVDRTPSDESPYVLYTTRLEKSEKGVWQTAVLTSKRGDDTCAG
ncbi:hypothetical protein C6Y14_08435 [Streptomyces dioscori]|uniref:Lipoprotein n=1 Tax=Streptomyces dioscori TaxID=2109333 RepID=A0A2P8QBQ6_9ACTN|nr:hypothetical protein [Streptomyces dioscori]PSM43653.1 hypothetical protein C6Y14_08435 [Streptomyces dioscori]